MTVKVAHDLESMSESALVSMMAKAKEKEAAAKADYNTAAAELQRRAMEQIEDRNIKFVRFRGVKKMAVVNMRGSLQLLNGAKLKGVVGGELFDSQTSTVQTLKYELKKPFEAALKAIATGDYDFNLSMDEVYDSLGADSKQRSVLTKKLKGAYGKDAEVLVSMFGEKDYDAELFCIYKIKNAELIRRFLPDATEEILDEIRRYVLVEESIGIGLV